MKVRCNWCGEVFNEDKVAYDEKSDKEYCPRCGEYGYLMDLKPATDCFAYSADKHKCMALRKLYCECDVCNFYKKANEVSGATRKLILEKNL